MPGLLTPLPVLPPALANSIDPVDKFRPEGPIEAEARLGVRLPPARLLILPPSYSRLLSNCGAVDASDALSPRSTDSTAVVIIDRLYSIRRGSYAAPIV